MSYTPTIKIKMRAFGTSSTRDDGMKELAMDLFAISSNQRRQKGVESGSLAAIDRIRKYYSSKGSALWEVKPGPTHGPGRRKTQWWRRVEGGWNRGKATARGVEFTNKTVGFAHKVTGGVISAKRKKFLTIPVIPQAHGLTAKTFSRTIAPLFAAKNSLMMTTADGGVKAVFALKKQTKRIPPRKDALPEEREYMPHFIKTLFDSLLEDFDSTS